MGGAEGKQLQLHGVVGAASSYEDASGPDARGRNGTTLDSSTCVSSASSATSPPLHFSVGGMDKTPSINTSNTGTTLHSGAGSEHDLEDGRTMGGVWAGGVTMTGSLASCSTTRRTSRNDTLDSYTDAKSNGVEASPKKDGLKEGKSKRKKILQTNKFYMSLPDHEKQFFAIVTEDISLQNTAGLQAIKRKLWKDKEAYKVMSILFMFCQLGLNSYTVLRMAIATYMTDFSAVNSITLTQSSLKVCSSRINPYCFETRLQRITLMQLVVSMEALIVVTMVFYIVWSSLCLLVCRDPESYAKRRYFAMIALPKLACKFSLISFLHIGNAERLKSFILRGEFRCLASLCLDSLRNRATIKLENTGALGRRASKLFEDVELGGKKKGKASKSEGKMQSRRVLLFEVVGVMMCGVIVLVALHTLLVKLMLVYFAGIFSYYEWNLNEWLLFMGFVNQLSGLSMSGEVEMLRILLFKFGGEYTRWDRRQIEACATYFRYFAARTVEQTGRVHAIVLFWTMSSADLQSLFQGHQRLKEQEAVRSKEMQMFEKLKSREQLVEMRDSLVGGFVTTQDRMVDILDAAAPTERLSILNKLQTIAVGELRLAARVQEHIWEWTKVELLENAGCLKPLYKQEQQEEVVENGRTDSSKPSRAMNGNADSSRSIPLAGAALPSALKIPGPALPDDQGHPLPNPMAAHFEDDLEPTHRTAMLDENGPRMVYNSEAVTSSHYSSEHSEESENHRREGTDMTEALKLLKDSAESNLGMDVEAGHQDEDAHCPGESCPPHKRRPSDNSGSNAPKLIDPDGTHEAQVHACLAASLAASDAPSSVHAPLTLTPMPSPLRSDNEVETPHSDARMSESTPNGAVKDTVLPGTAAA